MNFLIVCGGSGGHMAPGIAVAESLIEKGHNCKLVISKKEVDAQMIRNYSLDYIQAPGAPFSIKPNKLFLFLKTFYQSLLFYKKLIKTYQVDVIIGFGGFLSVGAILMGYFLKIPCMLHESNQVAGRSLKILGRLCTCVYLPMGVSLGLLPPKSICYCGFPLRKEINKIPKELARIRLGFSENAKLLLVMGGSQGAQSLTQWAKQNMKELGNRNIYIICLTGSKEKDEIIHYKNENLIEMQAHYKSFTHDISTLLSACDLAVSRAGAGSIAELQKCQTPSILVPYPYAANNHQYYNALLAEKKGHAILLPTEKMPMLIYEVLNFFKNRNLITQMQHNLEEYTYLDDTEILTNHILKINTLSK